MHPRGFFPALVSGLALATAASAAVSARAGGGIGAPPLFQTYCFECHGLKKPEADLSLQRLSAQPEFGADAESWEKIAEMIETAEMPPKEARKFPTDAERKTAAAWVRSSLKSYADAYAGEPGRVVVRRLTSGEYAYAIRDLTGIDVKTGIEASSDSVGGEGFTNFGDVQFVQDASIERYLEAAKLVADHAVIGAGPLEFYPDTGKSGLELFAINRINELHSTKGFRLVSGEGGNPFGLERYAKAFYLAWYFKHRLALGDPAATIPGLAAKEGIPVRFAEHIWTTLNLPNPGYPMRETVERWKNIPAPTGDIPTSRALARDGADAMFQALTAWPVWFFSRGALAAGGKGDEAPLIFDDTSLRAEPTHAYTYTLSSASGTRSTAGGTRASGRGGRGRGAGGGSAGGSRVFLNFANINPLASAHPVVIWRNARVVTRGPAEAVARGTGNAGAAGSARGRGADGPVLATQPLRELLSPEAVTLLGFGHSLDGSVMGPDDFATTDSVELDITPPTGGTAELVVDAELGADRNGVVRLALANTDAAVPTRGGLNHVFLGDPASAGYKIFRAGIAEFVAMLPPNSHSEANPADKDPVPLPFDSTYNTPEHDAFVLKVKYQRNDQFLSDYLLDDTERVQLNQAWSDLLTSFPYHDGYLSLLAEHYDVKLSSPHLQDLNAAQLAALPPEMRPHVVTLRASYDEATKALARAQPGQLDDALAFASRAWRRPLTAAETKSLRAFYQKSKTTNGLDHDGAIRALLARVLVSPAFLYRVENVASNTEKPLDGWEMASRLSFFLWASIPDDELRRAAAAGELSKPELLAKQVKRMTADPKARRLATEFFGQWLGFYRFDEYRGVDTGRFPEFTDEVRTAMYDEAVSTFEYLVRQGRPMRELLNADYTFLNQTLADFYGLKQDLGPSEQLTLVKGANAFNRGGVLRMGVMLTTTSAPLRTSPVKRGDWILRRLLGTPTPPPPANAGSIPRDDKAFNGQTLREQLEAHKRNATCAACHLKIDPLGFPLEAFDPVGRPRDKYLDGKPVDVTGEFADKTVISGTDGLLKYLQGQDKQITKMLGRKMLGYALGRTVQASDRPLLDEMAATGGDATFADLAVKIVTSRQFRNHAAGEDSTGQISRTTASVTRDNHPPSL